MFVWCRVFLVKCAHQRITSHKILKQRLWRNTIDVERWCGIVCDCVHPICIRLGRLSFLLSFHGECLFTFAELGKEVDLCVECELVCTACMRFMAKEEHVRYLCVLEC